MNRSRQLFPVLVLAGAGVFATSPALAGGFSLSAGLAASNEVGQMGDVGATGSVAVTLNQGQGEICFDLELSGLTTPPTRAHIHRGPAGVNGPIVADFFETGEPVVTDGCVPADKALVKEIRKNPGDFYVNVHNSTAPAGAVRGQLTP